MNYAIVDIETTGGSPKSSKITEIAIFKHDGEKVIDSFSTLLNPEMEIPAFITQLTGISNEMVKDAPKFFEVARQIVEFTKDTIFVAHNVGFDYGMIRNEFKTLGYDFRLPQLCTVRASRYVIPGMDSYSLGKLSRSLGIQISDRHRAGGDAQATAELFTMLMEKDEAKLASFVQHEVNPKSLHPNLDLDILDEIPNKIGVYRFYNDTNQLIYIGKSVHIKKRIEQHLRNTSTKKGIQMQKEISRIEYDLTGSELIALLRESELIKEHKPIYNRQLRRDSFPYGLYDYLDGAGYLRLQIAKTSTMQDTMAITSFTTKREANAYLERIVEEYQLCKKLSNLYKTSSSCFQYSIKQCAGACVGEEAVDDYNDRCQQFIESVTFEKDHFFIVDKGRQRNEKSLVYIENGALKGIGYAPFHFNRLPPRKWYKFLEYVRDDRDARTILRLFLRKNNDYETVELPAVPND